MNRYHIAYVGPDTLVLIKAPDEETRSDDLVVVTLGEYTTYRDEANIMSEMMRRAREKTSNDVAGGSAR